MRHKYFSAEVNYLLVNLMKYRCCGAEVIYFVFSSEMESRTLSQMCDRLYLPIFLYFAPYWPITLKLSTVVVRPVVF